MREKVWGGLILFATSLSLTFNIYTLLKQNEDINKNHEIPAKYISYIKENMEEKSQEEKKEELKNFVSYQSESLKNLKLGRKDPFEPLVKEEISEKNIEEERYIPQPKETKVIEKKIEKPKFVLRGILESSDKKLAILELENEERSFVVNEGDYIEKYKIEKIDALQRKIVVKDSYGNSFNIKM